MEMQFLIPKVSTKSNYANYFRVIHIYIHTYTDSWNEPENSELLVCVSGTGSDLPYSFCFGSKWGKKKLARF